jgi:hypothetical protein
MDNPNPRQPETETAPEPDVELAPNPEKDIQIEPEPASPSSPEGEPTSYVNEHITHAFDQVKTWTNDGRNIIFTLHACGNSSTRANLCLPFGRSLQFFHYW